MVWYGLFYFKTSRTKVYSIDINKLVKKKAETTKKTMYVERHAENQTTWI